MKKLFFGILIVIMLSSCQNLLFDWQIGDSNIQVMKSFQSLQKTQIKLTFDDQSYCLPANGIELTVLGNNIIVTNETITTLPITKLVIIPANSSIQIVTKSVSLNNGNACKMLGNVRCRLYY